jgi:hypothetical protein
MTTEAFALYARVLSPRGLLLVHVSNRFVDLEPVVAAAAQAGGWHAVQLLYHPDPDETAATPSQWIALSRDAGVVRALSNADAEWTPLPVHAGTRAWRDDYASLLPFMRGLH